MVYEITLIRIVNWHGRKTELYEPDKHSQRSCYVLGTARCWGKVANKADTAHALLDLMF